MNNTLIKDISIRIDDHDADEGRDDGDEDDDDDVQPLSLGMLNIIGR